MGIDEKQGSAAAALPAQQTSAYSLNAPQISGSMEENNNGHFFDIKSIRCLLLLFGLFFFFLPLFFMQVFISMSFLLRVKFIQNLQHFAIKSVQILG